MQISTDALTWTKRDSGSPFSLYAIAYGKALFVAVGNEGIALSSPDGIHWTNSNTAVTRSVTNTMAMLAGMNPSARDSGLSANEDAAPNAASVTIATTNAS